MARPTAAPLPRPEAVVCYLRVSTGEQSNEAQRPDLERLCALRGWSSVVWVEEVEGGAKHRPKLEALLGDAAAGRYTTVVVWAIDRLGRSMTETLARVAALDKAGVGVVSVQEPWLDTTGPTRGLLVAIFAWVAEQERERLRARTRAGMQAKKARGELVGSVPYGYQLGPDGVHLEAAPGEATVMLRVRAARAAGHGYSRIARALDAAGLRPRSGRAWDPTQVARIAG